MFFAVACAATTGTSIVPKWTRLAIGRFRRIRAGSFSARGSQDGTSLSGSSGRGCNGGTFLAGSCGLTRVQVAEDVGTSSTSTVR